MITTFIDRSSCLPASFLDRLEAMNEEKPCDARTVLIFEAGFDPNGVLRKTGAQFQYFQLAKRCRVITKVIGSVEEMDDYLRQIPLPDSIFVNAHGSIYSSEKGRKQTVCLGDNSHLHGDTPVPAHLTKVPLFLGACTAAKYAKKLSQQSSAPIWASEKKLAPSRSSITFCKKHQRLEMHNFDSQGKECVFLYEKGKYKRAACSKKDLFQVNREFISFLFTLDQQTLDFYDWVDLAIVASCNNNLSAKKSYLNQAYLQLNKQALDGKKKACYLLALMNLKGIDALDAYNEAVRLNFNPSVFNEEIAIFTGFVDDLEKQLAELKPKPEAVPFIWHLSKIKEAAAAGDKPSQFRLASSYLALKPPMIQEARKCFETLDGGCRVLGLEELGKVLREEIDRHLKT